jgi:hypothetical protein
LHGLQPGAPAKMRTALDELATAFEQVEQALGQSTKRGRQQLATVAAELSTDGKKISDYVASKCR